MASLDGGAYSAAAAGPWGAAAAASLLFCVSILLHELGHSLVAQHLGVRVESVTLFVFGGLTDERRVCHTGRHAVVSSAFPHLGEEDCLRGWHGSGTIFFGLCKLRCVFCQNWEISQRERGRELTAEEIADAALALQARGCHNIHLVPPEHVIPPVVVVSGSRSAAT